MAFGDLTISSHLILSLSQTTVKTLGTVSLHILQWMQVQAHVFNSQPPDFRHLLGPPL